MGEEDSLTFLEKHLTIESELLKKRLFDQNCIDDAMLPGAADDLCHSHLCLDDCTLGEQIPSDIVGVC